MVRPSLVPVIWSFLRIGAVAFGGGLAALPVFEAELVRRRQWLTVTETAETYAISQSVPGVIIVNFAVLAGLRLGGKRMALCAALAVALPAFLVILALAAWSAGRWDNRWVAAALSGLRPAVVAILVGAAIRLGRGNLHTPLLWLAAAAGGGLLLARILSPVTLILLGAAAGLGIHLWNKKMGGAS
ncbi:MAG TPA: chromate transporter [Kiritimatiellia bacterium]|jgi:chromate transporter|nr:chromate transporter [Lentisphaerota bacterium]HPC19918.1 chromate transporter [Kiritimatiellia bacterium]